MDQSNCKSAVTEHEKERIYRTTHVKNEKIFSKRFRFAICVGLIFYCISMNWWIPVVFSRLFYIIAQLHSKIDCMLSWFEIRFLIRYEWRSMCNQATNAQTCSRCPLCPVAQHPYTAIHSQNSLAYFIKIHLLLFLGLVGLCSIHQRRRHWNDTVRSI